MSTGGAQVRVGAGQFVEADLYEAPRALGRRRFDIVYTGPGARGRQIALWQPPWR